MTSSYLIAGCRTPVGKFLGGLNALSAPQLGAIVVREALTRSALLPGQVDEVILGNVVSAGLGQAPARQAALAAGLPDSVPALTINKVCGSGLKAVVLADQIIRAGDAAVIVAGGMESMSRAPHLLLNARPGWKYGNQQVVDALIHDGLQCPFEQAAMGEAAEYIAQKCQVDRIAQDRFAAESHRRAAAAWAEGRFAAEVVSIASGGKSNASLARDEGVRPESTIDKLAKLQPAFQEHGTVTAGNASQLSDGAAAVVVANNSIVQQLQPTFCFRVVASASSGVAPKELFLAPVLAIRQVLAKAGLTTREIDLVELNEAFSAQCLACLQAFDFPADRVNVNGGAIALGHPLGASGARILVTLMYALHQRRLCRGLVAICLGGGNAVAMIIERQG